MHKEIDAWMEAHWQEEVDYLQRLVRTPSLQGDEATAQNLVAERLNSLGLEVDQWEPSFEQLSKHPDFCSPRRSFTGSPNVVGVWKGKGGGHSLILNGHIDVVPSGERKQWSSDPFSAEVRQGKLYGRGASDMKGGNVSALFALACLKGLGLKLKGDLIFQSVIEEESGGAGTLAAIERGYRADVALIPEPTQLKIFPKQQGSAWFRINVRGKAAHAGTRYEGVSAIEKGVKVLDAIQALETKRNADVRDPLYAGVPIPVPINVGCIKGGEWPSSVPDQLELTGRMGVFPGEQISSAKEQLANILTKLDDPWLSEHPPELTWWGAQWLPGEIDCEHAFLQKLSAAYQDVLGAQPVIAASPWGTDGGLLTKAGVPAVVFGPGTTAMAHHPDEYIELDNILRASKIMARAILSWSGV